MPRPTALPLALLSLSLGACAIRRSGDGDVVRSVHFEGNGNFIQGTSDFHLRKAMSQQVSPWAVRLFPWVDPVLLDRAILEEDALRIEVWYAHHGYFDARVHGWDVRSRRMPGRTRKDGSRRGAVVDVVGQVAQGEPSLVRSIRFQGLENLGRPLQELLRNTAAIQAGDRYDIDAVKETEELILFRLREQSFAQATVRSETHAWPEEHAVEVTFVAQTGPPCRFGEVTVRGQEAVPEALIRDEIPIEPGRSFRASTLARTRQQLFALGTFSAVNVRPGAVPQTGENEPAVVPVEVTVTETRFRSLKSGAGVGLESGRLDGHVSLGFQHTNLARRLMRLELDAEAGYTVLTTVNELTQGDAPLTRAPTALLSANFTWPRVFGRRWTLTQDLDYEQGVESEYRFASPSWSPALTWEATRSVDLSTAWRYTWFDYLDLEVDLTRVQESRLGLDLTDPYTLSMLEEKLVWDGRDDPLFTRRGIYLTSTLGLAGAPGTSNVQVPVAGNFNFLKGFVDLRGYRSLAPLFHMHESMVLAGRIAGGAALPYGGGDRASVPYAERFYLGGGTSVRGWVTDHLGPYLCRVTDGDQVSYLSMDRCTSPGDQEDLVPIGGRVATWGSLELRKGIRWGVGMVAFLDAGMAWDTPADVLSLPPLASTGLGVRYASPVGPVRLDWAVRLDQSDAFQYEPRMNLHFSLTEAF